MTRSRDLADSADKDISGTVTLDDIVLSGGISKTGDLTLDVSGDIILDADGAQIRFKDAGTEIGVISNSSNDLQIVSSVSDADMIFRGNDGGTPFNALTLDMSSAGAATFNSTVMVGTTGVDPHNASSSSDVGVAVRNDGRVHAGANGQNALAVNRVDDGTIVTLKKAGGIVGTFGFQSTGFYMDGEGGHAGIRFAGNEISPRDNGADADDTVSLGESDKRFKDLYLSGGVYLGGTGSANYLEDVETGTWTPTLARWVGGNISATYTAQNGRYTKIGRMVTLSFDITVSSISSQGSSIAYIAGAPFNNPSSQDYDYAGTFGIRTCIPDTITANSIIKHATNTSLLIRQNSDFDSNFTGNWQAGIMRGSITYEYG